MGKFFNTVPTLGYHGYKSFRRLEAEFVLHVHGQNYLVTLISTTKRFIKTEYVSQLCDPGSW